MKLEHEFFKLPLKFDITQLQKEVAKFSDTDWHPHHEKFTGNYAIPLISVNGQQNNAFKGSMLPTPALKQSPYLQQVLASFNEVFGRSRLMRLDPGTEVPCHSDINHYWYNRVRIHIPIVTDEKVIFHCDDKQVHMKAGDTWIFDSWKNHKVVNHSDIVRVHLVIDTSGSTDFWQMVKNSYVPWLDKPEQTAKLLPFDESISPTILTEKFNSPVVMSPGELDGMLGELRNEINSDQNDTKIISQFNEVLLEYSIEWRQLWALYGTEKAGWEKFHRCRDTTYHKAKALGSQLRLSNQGLAIQMLIHCIIDPCLNPEVLQAT